MERATPKVEIAMIGVFRSTRPRRNGNDTHSKLAYEYRMQQWENDVDKVAAMLKTFSIPGYDADRFRALCAER